MVNKRKFTEVQSTFSINECFNSFKRPRTDSFKKLNFIDQFNQFRSTLCSDEDVDINLFKKLYDFFQKNIYNSKFISQIGPLCDIKFVTNLLSCYNCTLNQTDLLIFDILVLLENKLNVNLSLISPLVFGKSSKKYYNDLIVYGNILHKKLTPEQVLEYFDQKVMWDTLTKMTRFHHKKTKRNRRVIKADEKCYDPRFVLRSLLQIVKMDFKFNCRIMITSNALSFCFASTSFYDSTLRSLAYTVLQNFQKRLKQQNEYFRQKLLFGFVIEFFKNGILTVNQKACQFVSQFFARYSKIALTPTNPLYSPLTSFFIQKPFMDLESIPEFSKLFFSSSSENCREERRWMLRLIDDSFLDFNDYQILGKVYAIESFMGIFCTPMADLWNKLILLKIFRSYVELQAKDLFTRLDFDTWLTKAIYHPRTTIKEKLELTIIFNELINHLKKGFFDHSDIEKDENKLNVNLERRKQLLITKLKINKQKIVEYLRTSLYFDIENDIKRRDEIVLKLLDNELIK
uniref:Nucleolar pre-ribosomal-associated protein 1 C-terminal domain-containing protein n=1 Tax=Meloidogyne incognita TaxID=6306 RepID=A0A914L623_MELIC